MRYTILCRKRPLSLCLVDRILKKQRAEREAAERKRREETKELEKLVSDVEPQMPDHPMPSIATTTTTPIVNPPPQSPQQPAQTPNASSPNEIANNPPASSGSVDDSEKSHRHSRAGSALVNQFQNWKRKLGAPGSSPGQPERLTSVTEQQGEMSGNSRPRTPQPTVTPLSNIGQ